jgi:hypothetical protein
MKTIYNVAVLMDSQAQCNRMKQLCIDNEIDICEHAFIYDSIYPHFGSFQRNFGTWMLFEKTLITEAEFIELLKQEKL